MNETPDPLESELAELKPQDMSADVRQRIIADLGPWPLSPPRSAWAVALAAGFAAACLGVVLVASYRRDTAAVPSYDLPAAAPLPRTTASAFVRGVPLPTVRVYQGALSRSPEEFEALLDAESAIPFGSSVDRELDRFDRGNVNIASWPGEL